MLWPVAFALLIAFLVLDDLGLVAWAARNIGRNIGRFCSGSGAARR